MVPLPLALRRQNLIAVTETRLSADLSSNVSMPAYYNFAFRCRHINESHGGRVGIFITENIAFEVVKVKWTSIGTYESTFIRLPQSKSKDIIVDGIPDSKM